MTSKFRGPDIDRLFERRAQPLLPRKKFYDRVKRYFLFSLLILIFSVGMGMLGYHHFGNLGWIDAFYNASMILTGMGPVNEMPSDGGKIFASVYALFSGIAFLSMVAVFLAPFIHRTLHALNLDPEQDDNPNTSGEI